MKEFIEISKIFGGMPPSVLIAIVMLAAFALAGYAIYAVLAVSRK